MSRNRGGIERGVAPRWITSRIVMTTTTRRTFVIAIHVTVTTIRMNPIVLVLLRMANFVERALVSIMIVVVVKGNAIIFIVRTTGLITAITVAVLPGVALIVKRDGS